MSPSGPLRRMHLVTEPNDKMACLASRLVHTGHTIELRVEQVSLPNGRTMALDVVRHPGAAAVVPVDAAGHVYMVRQPRYAVGRSLLEIPAGRLEPHEAAAAGARRECEEEVGQNVGSLISLGAILTTPGFCDETVHLYLGQDLRSTAQNLDDNEFVTIERMPFADALAQVYDGRISDAKSICGLVRAAKLLAK